MGQVFAEAYRLRLMRGLEEALEDSGMSRIAGVDEAGRGCLAGPVVAAAVVVESGRLVPGVDDSKGLSAGRRQQLATAIRSSHPVSAVIAVSPDAIDRVNILQATRLAMKTAVERLKPAPQMVLVDAVPLSLRVPSLPVIRGDQISYAIACASILAKVGRDRLMADLHRQYPHYEFAANKGYGSAAHRRALAEYGPCGAHRLTFRSVLPKVEQRSKRRTGARSKTGSGRRTLGSMPKSAVVELTAPSSVTRDAVASDAGISDVLLHSGGARWR